MKGNCLMVIDPGLQLWGSERALAATLKALTTMWDRLVLVTPKGAALAEMAKHQALYGCITVEHAPIGLLHTRGITARLAAIVRLGQLISRHRPSRLYLNQAGLCRLLLPITRIFRVPLVIHVRLLEDVARVAPLRGTTSAPLHKVFISDAMLDVAIPYADSCTRIHKAYDPYIFGPLPQAAPPGTRQDFVSVGRLSQGKGQHLLIEAMAEQGLTHAGADLYGEGVEGDEYAARLTAQAAKLFPDKRVLFRGFRRDVTERLADYRFLVSTSKYESLGRVVMEAWEAGLVPIVYGSSGGAVEIVRKAGGGLIYEEWTASSLATVLRQALAMPDDQYRKIARAGLEWGISQLSVEKYTINLREALFSPNHWGRT